MPGEAKPKLEQTSKPAPVKARPKESVKAGSVPIPAFPGSVPVHTTATIAVPIPAFPGALPLVAAATSPIVSIHPFPPVHVKAPLPKFSPVGHVPVQTTGVWATAVDGNSAPRTPTRNAPKASPKTPDLYAEKAPVPAVEPAVPKTPPEAIAIANSEKAARATELRARVRRQEMERLKLYFPGAFRNKMSSLKPSRGRFFKKDSTSVATSTETSIPEELPDPAVSPPAIPPEELPPSGVPPSDFPRRKRKRTRPSKANHHSPLEKKFWEIMKTKKPKTEVEEEEEYWEDGDFDDEVCFHIHNWGCPSYLGHFSRSVGHSPSLAQVGVPPWRAADTESETPPCRISRPRPPTPPPPPDSSSS